MTDAHTSHLPGGAVLTRLLDWHIVRPADASRYAAPNGRASERVRWFASELIWTSRSLR
jgi:hypothetical protein